MYLILENRRFPPKLAHRWHSFWYFYPLQKQDQNFDQRTRLSQWDFRVCGNRSISLTRHWFRNSHRDGCNWLTARRGFIASMATLLPHCSSEVKGREWGEATFAQTALVYYSSFVPGVREGVRANAGTGVCLWFSVGAADWRSRGGRHEVKPVQ